MNIKRNKQAKNLSEELIKFSPALESSPKNILVTDEALSRRQIHIIDEITETSFEQIKNLYDELVEESETKPIHFIVGSPGGHATSMLGVMNLIILSKTPCYTYLFSEACSAGAWIYLCGHKRFAPKTKLVSFMLHPIAWGGEQENLGNHSSYNKYVEKLSSNLIEFTTKQTKIPLTKLKRLATTDTQFFIGDEIFEQGIATDELTTSTFWLTPKVPKKAKTPKTKETNQKLLLD